MGKRKESSQALAKRLGANHSLWEFFFELHDRWQDEKEYEDIADYATAMRKNFAKDIGATGVEARKKPFFCIVFHFKSGQVAILRAVGRKGEVVVAP